MPPLRFRPLETVAARPNNSPPGAESIVMELGTNHLQTPSIESKETEEDSHVSVPLASTFTPPTLPPPILESNIGTAERGVGLPVPSNPTQISTTKRRVSIERFIGKSPECFVPAKYRKPSKNSSTHGSGPMIRLWSALKSSLTSLHCSTTEDLFAVLGRLRKWSSTRFNTWPFEVSAWAKRITQTGKLLPHTTEGAVEATPSDVIKSVPIPLFPIRVFYGKPPPFSLERQKRVMRWRYRWHFGLHADIIQDPNTQLIRETVEQYIEFIAPETETISVDLLAQGAFNQAYDVVAENNATGFRREYIFRVALPIFPHYKVESDVATTEYVRYTTDIPVPIIYAFDSSPSNKLGFEWMLMEKVQGKMLYESWDTMEYQAKEKLTKTVAKWMDQLSRHEFSKIGSLYCRQRAGRMEFYMGPALHSRLYEGDRLLQDVFRGPFDSLQAFYDAILDSTERHVNDPRHSARHERDAALREKGLPLSEDDLSDESEHGAQKSEKEILAHADDKDRRNERQGGVQEMDLEWLPDELAIFRELLPKLCPLPSASEPMTTVLTHPDLSSPNIFVDDSGAPVALIDWERARIEPNAHLIAFPRFLIDYSSSDPDYYYAPPGVLTSTGRKENKLFIHNDERLAQIRDQSERVYRDLMCRIQETHLRAIYRKELKRLESPLCKALERDTESLEQQLIKRVFWPEQAPPNSVEEWAAEQLGESVLTDSDEENTSEDQQGPGEGKEVHGVEKIVDTASALPVDN